MESAVARRYILLRSREGNHAGYARLEVRHGRGTVALRMAVPGGKGAVRILLLAGDAETGSVLDLGVSPLDGEGQGQCYRDNLPLPGGFKLYHTLAVVSDWPTPALLLHGPLGGAHASPVAAGGRRYPLPGRAGGTSRLQAGCGAAHAFRFPGTRAGCFRPLLETAASSLGPSPAHGGRLARAALAQGIGGAPRVVCFPASRRAL